MTKDSWITSFSAPGAGARDEAGELFFSYFHGIAGETKPRHSSGSTPSDDTQWKVEIKSQRGSAVSWMSYYALDLQQGDRVTLIYLCDMLVAYVNHSQDYWQSLKNNHGLKHLIQEANPSLKGNIPPPKGKHHSIFYALVGIVALLFTGLMAIVLMSGSGAFLTPLQWGMCGLCLVIVSLAARKMKQVDAIPAIDLAVARTQKNIKLNATFALRSPEKFR